VDEVVLQWWCCRFLGGVTSFAGDLHASKVNPNPVANYSL
jgi:hypothetical protein